jgi:hypothetical protein
MGRGDIAQFLTLALDRGEWPAIRFGIFKPATHLIRNLFDPRDWVGPRTGT